MTLTTEASLHKTPTLNPAEDDIYKTIHKAIVERRLPPGTKLTEEILAAIFNASRRRIKTVLQELAHDKCVDLIPFRGAFVAQPSPQEAKDIFEARLVLETHIMQNLNPNEQNTLTKELERNTAQERQAHDDDRRSDAIRLSGEFHLLLANIAGNQVMAEMLRDLIARTSLIIAMYGGTQSTTALCPCDEHDDILDAIKQNNHTRATDLMIDHLKRIEAQLVLEIKPNEPIDLWQALS